MFKIIVPLKDYKEKILLNIIIMMVIVSFFISPKLVLNGAKQGMIFCTETLVPSLFSFMVLVSLMVNLDICKKLGSFLNHATQSLFKLPGVAAPVILLGLIGGYPTGASGIATLFKNRLINKQQAEKMACFVVGSGPVFVITVVGSQLLQNERLGVILFLSQVLSSLLVGITYNIFFNNKDKIEYKTKGEPHKFTFSEALVDSVTVASNNIITMCSFVVLFSSFLEIIKNGKIITTVLRSLEHVGLNKNIANVIITLIFEVSNGCFDAVKNHAPLFLVSFGIAWAGICVHLQIFYCLRDIDFSKFKFIMFRLLHGLYAGVIFYVILSFLPVNIDVSCIKIYTIKDTSFYFAPSSMVLLFLCMFFLSTLTPTTVAFNSVNYKKRNVKSDYKKCKTKNKQVFKI